MYTFLTQTKGTSPWRRVLVIYVLGGEGEGAG